MTTPQDPADPRDRADLHPSDQTPVADAEEQEVAALLADALGRGPVATPAEVVARLDDVLAGLVAERSRGSETAAPLTPASGATVVPLDERRRPSRLPRLLLAAAAVVVGGYAVSHLPSSGSDGLSNADSAGGSSASSAEAPGSDEPGTGSRSTDTGGTAGRRSHTGGGLAGSSQMSVAPELRRDHLAADVRRVVRMFPPRPLVEQPQDPPPPSDGGSSGPVEVVPDCPVPRLLEGQRLYQVTYQDQPAGLVVGPPRKGSVEVTVYGCDDGGTELTRIVPAP